MHKLTVLIVATAALSMAHVAGAAELNKKDSKYMSDTAHGLISEVKMGDMAQKQAQDDRVKQFGKRMVEDHGKELDELKQLASQKNVTLPDAPNKEQSEEAEKLSKLSGKDFDKEYVKYEAKDHKQDVKDQGKEMKHAADADVKKFAIASYKTVSMHKKVVDGLHRQIGK